MSNLRLAVSFAALTVACTSPGSRADSASRASDAASTTITIATADPVPPVAAPALAAMDASARVPCAEPRSIKQLGTVKEAARFRGELLVGKKHAYDPETLAESAVPREPSSTKSGASRRYQETAGGVGLITIEETDEAKVVDLVSKKTLTKVPRCSARGAPVGYGLSATGRFALCHGDDSIELTETRPTHSAKRDALLRACADHGMSLAPDDTYSVTVPHIWSFSGEQTRPEVLWCDWDAATSRTIASVSYGKAIPIGESYFGDEVAVAFCGSVLFAVSLAHEVAVFRGKDAALLASAPALLGGVLSFSASGQYMSQTRSTGGAGAATTIYRLDP